MSPNSFWTWVGGRRFVLTVGAGLVNTILRWYDKIDQLVFRDLIIATVGAYLTSSTVQKVKEWKDNKNNASPTP